MLEIGSIVGENYRILSLIGKGGMSAVYLAINDKVNKPWAIKEVRKDGKQDFEIVKQSLIAETDLLKKLKHPKLPSIVDIIDQDDSFLIVMDYIEGVTLKQIMDDEGVQSQEKVVDWAIQLCDVLEYLHNSNPVIIYRDMKPANVMLKPDGSVVLIDFGTAREYKDNANGDTTCLGTQGYAAPEQFGNRGQTDARTDIYCLGATMYHLVTGHNPTEPPYELYPITHWNPYLSSGLEKIILKCTQKNPKDRFQSAEELRNALLYYKELDKAYIKKLVMKLVVFAAVCMACIVCAISAINFNMQIGQAEKYEYDALVESAERSTDKQERIDLYLKAIATQSGKDKAYIGLMDCFIEDGVFDDNEEQILQTLNVSVEKYFSVFKNQNISGYGDFCYDVGNAYWYYYTHEENKKINSVKWFQEAADAYSSDADKKMEYKRCLIYIELGSFYKKIVNAQIEGTDYGLYGQYWDNLLELKKANDEMPDRDIITLRLYQEIVSKSMEYAKYLKEDGVPMGDIEDMYDAISKDINEMRKGNNTSLLEEIDKLEMLIEKSNQLLNSGYKE